MLLLSLLITYSLHTANSYLLLTERCHTDDLLPDLPVPYLSPRHVDSKVLGLNVIVDRSQPGGSWTPHVSPPVRWRSQWADRARWPKNFSREHFSLSETGEQPVMLRTVSYVVCLVSKASRCLARVLVTVYVSQNLDDVGPVEVHVSVSVYGGPPDILLKEAEALSGDPNILASLPPSCKISDPG